MGAASQGTDRARPRWPGGKGRRRLADLPGQQEWKHQPRAGQRPGSPERKSRTCWMRSRVRLTSSSIWERLVLTWVSRR